MSGVPSHNTSAPARDVFLSHKSDAKPLVQRLAADIEADRAGAPLTVWLDEAEIRPGQSIPGMVNQGLETSRFIAIVMTPSYFEGNWTDAEWHAAIHGDPDNKSVRILPILAADCPRIPYLLRHLRAIDIRGDRYAEGLAEVLRALRDEPLPRPVAHRGQLVTPGGRIDRATLLSERAAPQALPDVVDEKLYCNLLPVETLPQYIYAAPIRADLFKRRGDPVVVPSKREIRDSIHAAQDAAGLRRFMPAFRVHEGEIYSFHDLQAADGPLASVAAVDEAEEIATRDMLGDENERRLVTSLLNIALARHAIRVGLTADPDRHQRFFFPPKNGAVQQIEWVPRRRKAKRTVAKPFVKDGRLLFWRHLAAYVQAAFLAQRFFVRVTPTWVITDDGAQPRGGPGVGRFIIRWTGAERNLHVLYHVRFWTTFLAGGKARILVRAGDQVLEIASVPAFVQQPYGVAGDQRDLLGLLDEEASLIAEEEDRLADEVAQIVVEGGAPEELLPDDAARADEPEDGGEADDAE